MPDFVEVTELAGDDVTSEQVTRICQRYYWAAEYCSGKDVLEVACGTGQGIGYLGSIAKSVVAGDSSAPIIEIAKKHYGGRFYFSQFDAQTMPYPNASFDVIIIFEALYYLPNLTKFFAECRRVLRSGGMLLIATANKDLYDFNPSPHSYRYLGVTELSSELKREGFSASFFGDSPVENAPLRQRILRPVKMIASRFGLIPKSMEAKKFLKRFVFGGLIKMPAEITKDTCVRSKPVPVASGAPDRRYKVIFCAARADT